MQKELINFLGRGAEKEIVLFQLRGDHEEAELSLKINKERHISRTIRGVGKDWMSSSDSVADNIHVKSAQAKTNDFLEYVPQFLSKKKTYTRAYVTEMLKIIENAINSSSQNEKYYSFTRQYHVDLFCTACNYVVVKFEKMVEKFNRENDPVISLKNEKYDELKNIFRNKCFQIEHGKAVATTLREVLIKAVRKKLGTSLARQIVDQMKAVDICFKNKQALKAKILVSLAEGNDFSKYTSYLNSPEPSFQFWASKYTEEFCNSKQTGKQFSNVQEIALAEIKDWITEIGKIIRSICRKHSESPNKGLMTTICWEIQSVSCIYS